MTLRISYRIYGTLTIRLGIHTKNREREKKINYKCTSRNTLKKKRNEEGFDDKNEFYKCFTIYLVIMATGMNLTSSTES